MNFISELLQPKSSVSTTGGKPSLVEPEKKVGGGKTRRLDKYGSRRKVWNGTAEMTNGGLRKDDLIKNNKGRIVSVKRHSTMKNRFIKTD